MPAPPRGQTPQFEVRDETTVSNDCSKIETNAVVTANRREDENDVDNLNDRDIDVGVQNG